MNVGIVTTWFERGAAYVSRQYVDALKNHHDVFVYARGEKYAIGDPNWDSERVTWGVKVPINRPQAIDLDDFKNWIVLNKIETIIFNEQQWWIPVIVAMRLGVKVGAYVDYYTAETVPFFNLYDFLVCNTERHHSVFTWHPQAYFVPWGTNLKLFSPRTLSPVDQNKVTFFHSCGLSPERKGTDVLLSAFDSLSSDQARLVIHTQVDLTTALPGLKKIIDGMVGSGRLTIIHQTVSAPGLYFMGDVYVYPTRLEGVGLTMIEAMASGLPLIVPDNPPMNEFVGKEFCQLVKVDKLSPRGDGYYWPQCTVDPNDLVRALNFYVDRLDRLESFKKMARLYAEDKFDWSKNSQSLPVLIDSSKIIPTEQKANTIKHVLAYEKKRANWRVTVYLKFPFLFLPFKWLWPIIKKFYIAK